MGTGEETSNNCNLIADFLNSIKKIEFCMSLMASNLKLMLTMLFKNTDIVKQTNL